MKRREWAKLGEWVRQHTGVDPAGLVQHDDDGAYVDFGSRAYLRARLLCMADEAAAKGED